jgi:hypothetical protein
MKKKNIKYFFLLLIIGLFACNDTEKCFKPYVKEFNQSHNPYYDWGFNLYFRIDSILHTEGRCEYYTETFIALDENTISYKAALYIEDNQIIARLLDLKSEPFTLFDFQATKGKINQIEIEVDSKRFYRECSLEDIITKEEGVMVFVYKIEELFYFFADDSVKRKEDVFFFVTKEYGIIGSYISSIENDGQEIIIAPAGDILAKYIDYSNVELRLIQ